MSLVPMRAILEATEKYNYAQGAFNVNAVAQAKAVLFFILVAAIGLIQLRATRKKEVQQ